MVKDAKRDTISKRGAILLRILDCINAGDYDDEGDYIIFGKDLDEILDEAGRGPCELQDSFEREPIRELVSDIRTHSGRKRAARRTSLTNPPALGKLRGLNALSPETIRALEKLVKEGQSSGGTGHSESQILDELDAFYAQEVLAKLPKIVGSAFVL